MRENFSSLLLFIIIIQLYRIFVLLNAQIDLYVDEAYYWGWSKELAFGYYSKPPMIAWVIALFTHLCGDTAFCIKLPALIFHPLTAILIFFIAKELFDERIGFWSGVAYITLPAVSMSSMIISTDVVFLFFWALTLYAFIKAIRTDSWLYWLIAAVSAGCGLLSKYTMIIFIVSVFLYLVWDKRFSYHLKNPKLYITMILATLIYLPNLWWNAHHEFITFIHTRNLSGIEHKSHFHPNKLIEFLASQFLVFGPIFFAAFLYALRYIKELKYRLLFAFSLPFLAVISLQAFLSKALANWAAPTYIAATILVVALMIRSKRLLIASIILNILLTLLFYHYHTVAKVFHIELTSHNDPYKRVLGYSVLAKKLEPILKNYPGYKLLFDDRTTMAEMIYYLKPHPFDAAMLNPKHVKASQYHLFNPPKLHQNYIYITKSNNLQAARYFASFKKITTIKIQLYKDYSRTYYIFEARDFKGYR
ncbi:glycosyltransferase family 39 protein [Nitratiruptor sp. YY09-18]|uniref:ArnT family glycosyltransferase n=1 Tax=Nitratiruptor sp. YY09-18 TaxID=2724901 RepID=UPI0019164804|nr:glycosyltransferase family 39 protein [Nitratiruptor sp. YY09-18]BCD67895.1 hypothetical protein NitYY0918_C0802 [Nitratiruptor sp. YY09-18]